jgi:hypothetical protein
MPVPSPPALPVSQSVDRVVKRMAEEREDPCKRARDEGRSCFPASIVERGEEYSVRDSIEAAIGQSGPTPGGAPTIRDMVPYSPRPSPATTPLMLQVTFDPGCVGKSVLKSFQGKSDVYYLYRMRDRQGDRAALFDHKMEPATFQGELAFLGRYNGECAALSALRHEELVHPPSSPRPFPGPSPQASNGVNAVGIPRPAVTPSPP